MNMVYMVRVKYGRMELPLVEVVVARDPAEAIALVIAGESGDVKISGEPCPLGEAIDPTPRVIR